MIKRLGILTATLLVLPATMARRPLRTDVLSLTGGAEGQAVRLLPGRHHRKQGIESILQRRLRAAGKMDRQAAAARIRRSDELLRASFRGAYVRLEVIIMITRHCPAR